MLSSQVQEPQILGMSPNIHMGPGSPPIPATSVKSENDKFIAGTYGSYGQPVTSLSPPVGGTGLHDMEAQSRLYGMPVSFPSGFRPFYISLPGAPPMHMAAAAAAIPSGAATQDIYHQHAAPQGLANVQLYHNAQQNYQQPPPPPPPSTQVATQLNPQQQQLQHQLQQPDPQSQPQPQPQSHSHSHSHSHSQLHAQLHSHQPELSPHLHRHIQPNTAEKQQHVGSTRKDSATYLNRDGPVASQRTSLRNGSETYPYRHKDPQLSKRTKVSRACDECRRKKTRCDIDAEHEICTPCARAGVPCTFARAQLKRGPAKKRLSHGSLPLPKIYSPSHQPASLAEPSSATPRKQRSQSDVIPKGLPSIEALLGYSSTSSHGSGSTSSPRNDSISSTASSQSAVVGSAPSSSGFPLLVEAACRQSESPIHQSEAKALSLPSPPQQQSQQSSSTLTENRNTPPAAYDVGIHGVSHSALMEYYTFVHPTFPLLPDLVSDFDKMFRSAGPPKDYIVSSLSGTSSNVPFGLGNAGNSVQPAAREAHLIAVLLTYLRTLDSAWLGAGVAACAVMTNSADGEKATAESVIRLTALVLIFDRLHSAVFGTPKLAPDYLQRVGEACSRLAPTMRLLGLIDATEGSEGEQFVTASQATLKILGRLHNRTVTLSEAQKQLHPLIPQLQRTPLEQFATAVLGRSVTA